MRNKSILLTGATGSFGNAYIESILKSKIQPKKLVVYSRDELKQFELQKKYDPEKYPFMRYFIGDIRDYRRLKMALEDIDVVIHAAALKQVDTAEYNPFEFIKTNILGAQNLVEACLETKVSNVIALSTDKAVSPVNLYGATKLCSDKIFISANQIKGKKNIKFSLVRYGNVLGSRGSVLPKFINQINSGAFTITDSEMTRFNILLSEGIDLVNWAIKNNIGGEIFVPKLASYKITDLAKALNEKNQLKFIGIRPGEKIHEVLLSKEESNFAYDTGKNYIILNHYSEKKISKKLKTKYKKFKKVEKDFEYQSGSNHKFLNVKEIRDIINKNFLI